MPWKADTTAIIRIDLCTTVGASIVMLSATKHDKCGVTGRQLRLMSFKADDGVSKNNPDRGIPTGGR